MNYVLLGKTGLRVSEICLGTMTFGKETDEKNANAIMNYALERGINFFDTANIYNGGETEKIIGRWISPHREHIILASKVHFPTGQGPNEHGSSRRHIILEVEKSLKRLQTDWIDILYFHHWDTETPIEESLGAVSTLIEQGKILYAAASNFAAWQAEKALGVAEHKGLARIMILQPMYNLLKRQAEVEILPMALAENLAVCPYNPLAAGILTGKYLRGETGRLNENEMYKKRYADSSYTEITTRFVQFAEQVGYPPAALALAWVKYHPAVTAPIIGARNLDQLKDTLRCLDISLSPDEYASISSLSPQPPLATDREK